MTRKETILIAVVVNAGLLAILFITAVIYDDTQKVFEPIEFMADSAGDAKSSSQTATSEIASATPGDEVDNVLKYYSESPLQPIVVETESLPEPQTTGKELYQDSGQFFEITVKKGDVLEKIARANGTSVKAIKQANSLESERLKIGQVLKIPGKKESDSLKANPLPTSAPSRKLESGDHEPIYYSIKSGDNPWKIAKQFNVDSEDILRLNGLDEDKARNLKVGDRIRVK